MNSTEEARRETHDAVKPHVGKLHKKIMRTIIEFWRENKSWPYHIHISEYSGIKLQTVGPRLSELRKMGLVISHDNPRGNKKGTLNALSRKAHSYLMED